MKKNNPYLLSSSIFYRIGVWALFIFVVLFVFLLGASQYFRQKNIRTDRKQVLEVINTYIAKLNNNDVSGAYALRSSHFRQMTSLSQFEKEMQNIQAQHWSNFVVYDSYVSKQAPYFSGIHELRGGIKGKDNQQFIRFIVLQDINTNAWTIESVDVSQSRIKSNFTTTW